MSAPKAAPAGNSGREAKGSRTLSLPEGFAAARSEASCIVARAGKGSVCPGTVAAADNRDHVPELSKAEVQDDVDVAKEEQKEAAGKLREILSTYNEAEDLINIGAYAKGSNPKIDYAVEKIDAVNACKSMQMAPRVSRCQCSRPWRR